MTQLPRRMGLVRDAPDCLASTAACPECRRREYLLHAIDAAPFRAGDAGNSVVLGQRFVQECVVGIEDAPAPSRCW